MKKIVVFTAFVLLALSGCQNNTPTDFIPSTALPTDSPTTGATTVATESSPSEAAVEPKEFGWTDLVVGQTGYGASEAELISLFGQPDEYEEYVEGATGNSFRVLHYNDKMILNLVQTDEAGYTLRDAQILSDGIDGPRGLRVGDSMETVLRSFRNERLGNHILYSAGTTEVTPSETIILPPRGYIAFEPDDEGRIEVHYDFPTSAYQTEEDERGFVYLPHAMLMFKIKDDFVHEIRWSVAAMAE